MPPLRVHFSLSYAVNFLEGPLARLNFSFRAHLDSGAFGEFAVR